MFHKVVHLRTETAGDLCKGGLVMFNFVKCSKCGIATHITGFAVFAYA